MKKILYTASLALTVACSQNPEPKVLIVYYSQTQTTETVAKEFQTRLGADMEAIVPVNPYDGSYDETISRCLQEMQEGVSPEIQPLKADIASYDVIFIGFPIWFGTYALPVKTFLEGVDLSGKKVVPFSTFGSGGIDNAEKAIAEKFPEAEVLPGYGVRTARIDAAPAEIDRYLKENGFVEGEVEKIEAFPEAHAASEEEAAVFNRAVEGYRMLNAEAKEVSVRDVPGGKEYLFTAADRMGAPDSEEAPRTIRVYVLQKDGVEPVFTKVVR